MNRVLVHSRVIKRHPELTEADVCSAWRNYVRMEKRRDDDDYYVAVGFDTAGRAIEMVAVETFESDWYVFHAMTPPTKSVMRELGLTR